MKVASSQEIDKYFAENRPVKTRKVLCHKCGGAVDNGVQQPQERHCSQDHQALAVDYIRICPECGVVTR